MQAGVPIATLTTMGGGNVSERLAAAKSLCRFVLRIPKGASDNDQERSPGSNSAPPLDATGLLKVPSAPSLDATTLLRGGPRGETLDATGMLPGVETTELAAASTALPAVELHDAQAVLQAIDMQSLVCIHILQLLPVSSAALHLLQLLPVPCAVLHLCKVPPFIIGQHYWSHLRTHCTCSFVDVLL